MTLQIHKLTQYLRGWGHYYLIANAYQLTVDLDHWIRRRIRMCYWRQWRKPRTKVRSLMKLGVSERLAIACGITSTKSRRLEAKALVEAQKQKELTLH